MPLVPEFLEQVYWFVKESAVYILFGVAVAGLLRFAVPERWFHRLLGGDDLKSVTAASLFGIPLPLCSCSVLPVIIAMRKRGASKGATTSFLISTPETSIESISITYALLDPVFTIMRPVAALVSAVVTGSMVNVFVHKGWDDPDPEGETVDGEARDSTDAHPAHTCTACAPPSEGGSFLGKVTRHAGITLMDDLTPLLILAFLGSGLIAVALPDTFFEHPLVQGWSGMIIMLLVGIPFYVCAASSTPIVAALLLKGLSPGAALVFLLAGPVTNLGTIAAVYRHLGRRIMLVYLVSMAVLTLLMGGIMETLYAGSGVKVKEIVGRGGEFLPESVKLMGLALLLALMAASAWRTRLFGVWADRVRSALKPYLPFDPVGRGARTILVLLLLGLYLLSCFTIIDVGEVGWRLTFGRVERDGTGTVVTHAKPGLEVHAPWPFQTFVKARPDAVRKLTFGEIPETEGEYDEDRVRYLLGAENDLEDEAQVMDGEEGLVSLRFSVHYRVRDAFAYTFGFDDPVKLVRSLSAAAVRTVCARQATQRILVGYRHELEEAALVRLQERLDVVGSGVEALRVEFLDVHAPAAVHFAFRDVASASEDRHRQELEGERTWIEILADARSRAYRSEVDAEIYRHERVAEAKGRARAFVARAEAFDASREITALRLYLEGVADALEHLALVLPLAEGIDVDLWLQRTIVPPPFLERGTGSGGGEAPANPGREDSEKTERDTSRKDTKTKALEEPDWVRAYKNRM